MALLLSALLDRRLLSVVGPLGACVPLMLPAQSFDLEQFDQLFRPRLRMEARWTPSLPFEDVKGRYEERNATGVFTFPVYKRWSAKLDLNAQGKSPGELLKNTVRIRASQVLGHARYGYRQLVFDDGVRVLHSASLGATGISLTKKYRVLFWSLSAHVNEEEGTLDRAVPRFTGVLGKMHAKGLRRQFFYGLAMAVSDGFVLPLPFFGSTMPLGARWDFQYLLPVQLAFGYRASSALKFQTGIGGDGYRSGFPVGEGRVNINYTALRAFANVRYEVKRRVQFRVEVSGLAVHSIRLPDPEGDLERLGIDPGVQVVGGVSFFFGPSTLERLLNDVLK